MEKRRPWSSWILSFALAAGGGGCVPSESSRCVSSDVADFQARNLFGDSFGIRDGELALTFDDGPSARTLELARYLANKKVPAVFFMQGAAAEERLDVVRQVAALTIDGKPAHLIANHTWDHVKLTTTSSGNVVRQVKNVEEALSPYIKGTRFFRAPYGAFGGASMALALNQHQNLKRYIGPVYWDIGGELSGRYAADWACWPNGISVANCAQRYVNEAVDRKKGIVLAHDVHSKTVDMFMGTAASTSLVDRLAAKGFRFVRLDKDPQAVRRWGEFVGSEAPEHPGPEAPSGAGGGAGSAIAFSVREVGSGVLAFEIEVPEASLLRISLEGSTGLVFPEQKGKQLVFEHGFPALGNKSLVVESVRNGGSAVRKSFLFKVEKASAVGLVKVLVDGREVDPSHSSPSEEPRGHRDSVESKPAANRAPSAHCR